MRIDKVGPVSSSNSIKKGNGVKNIDNKTDTVKSDRIDFAQKAEIGEAESKIKNNILKFENIQTAPEMLEEIKQRISENKYFVETEAIVNSILK